MMKSWILILFLTLSSGALSKESLGSKPTSTEFFFNVGNSGFSLEVFDSPENRKISDAEFSKYVVEKLRIDGTKIDAVVHGVKVTDEVLEALNYQSPGTLKKIRKKVFGSREHLPKTEYKIETWNIKNVLKEVSYLSPKKETLYQQVPESDFFETMLASIENGIALKAKELITRLKTELNSEYPEEVAKAIKASKKLTQIPNRDVYNKHRKRMIVMRLGGVGLAAGVLPYTLIKLTTNSPAAIARAISTGISMTTLSTLFQVGSPLYSKWVTENDKTINHFEKIGAKLGSLNLGLVQPLERGKYVEGRYYALEKTGREVLSDSIGLAKWGSLEIAYSTAIKFMQDGYNTLKEKIFIGEDYLTWGEVWKTGAVSTVAQGILEYVAFYLNNKNRDALNKAIERKQAFIRVLEQTKVILRKEERIGHSQGKMEALRLFQLHLKKSQDYIYLEKVYKEKLSQISDLKKVEILNTSLERLEEELEGVVFQKNEAYKSSDKEETIRLSNMEFKLKEHIKKKKKEIGFWRRLKYRSTISDIKNMKESAEFHKEFMEIFRMLSLDSALFKDVKADKIDEIVGALERQILELDQAEMTFDISNQKLAFQIGMAWAVSYGATVIFPSSSTGDLLFTAMTVIGVNNLLKLKTGKSIPEWASAGLKAVVNIVDRPLEKYSPKLHYDIHKGVDILTWPARKVGETVQKAKSNLSCRKALFSWKTFFAGIKKAAGRTY